MPSTLRPVCVCAMFRQHPIECVRHFSPRARRARMSDTEMAGKPQDDVVICDACPVLCRIRPGKTGACDRYANIAGILTRTDPMVLAQQVIDDKGALVPFLSSPEWDGSLVAGAPTFVTGIGSGTT